MNTRDRSPRSCAAFPDCSALSSRTAGPRRLKALSSWRGWPDIAREAKRRAGWSRSQGSYHGRTFGSMSLTGQDKYRKGFEPLLEEVKFVARNDAEALRAAVNDNTCAIVLEPIFGEGGIHECSVEFLQECRRSGRPSSCCPGFRRDPMRSGTHRDDLRFPNVWRDA